MNADRNLLIKILAQLTTIYNTLAKISNMNQVNIITNRELFYKVALGYLGKDASPNDIAPDEYGCAESVNDIHQAAFGTQIGGDVSTYRLYAALKDQPVLFEEIDQPLSGDICISPTGYQTGKNPPFKNGHVGIVGENGVIMSNDSGTGKFMQNYSLATWRARYVDMGGFLMKFYRRK